MLLNSGEARTALRRIQGNNPLSLDSIYYFPSRWQEHRFFRSRLGHQRVKSCPKYLRHVRKSGVYGVGPCAAQLCVIRPRDTPFPVRINFRKTTGTAVVYLTSRDKYYLKSLQHGPSSLRKCGGHRVNPTSNFSNMILFSNKRKKGAVNQLALFWRTDFKTTFQLTDTKRRVLKIPRAITKLLEIGPVIQE